MSAGKEIPLSASDYKELSTALRRISFFSNLSMGMIERVLSLTHLYEAKAGKVLFRKGEIGDALYVIQSGSVEVLKHKFAWMPGGRLAQLKAGDFFGEMALLDQPYRTATVVTKEPTRLFVILASRFNDLLRDNPEMRSAIRDVAATRAFQNK